MKNTKLYLITIICLTLCWALVPINQATAETITETFSGSNASYSKSITIPNLKSATATVTSAYGGNPTVNLTRNGDILTMQVSGGSPNSTWNEGGCYNYTTTKSTTMDGTEAKEVTYDGWGNYLYEYVEESWPYAVPINEGNCSGSIPKTSQTPTSGWEYSTSWESGETCKTNNKSCYMSTDQTYTGHNTNYFTYSNFDLVCQDVGYPNIPSSYYFNNDGCIGTLSLRETNEGSETFAGQGSDVYINGELCMTIYTTFDVCASYTGQVYKQEQECRKNSISVYYRYNTITYSGDISCQSCWGGWYDYYYSYTVTITYSTTSNPTIEATLPSNTIYSDKAGHNKTSCSGTVKDVDIGDQLTVYYKINNGSKTALASSITANGTDQAWNGTIDVSWVSEGAHTLCIWAEDDKGGKSAETSISFNMDRTAPTVLAPPVTVNSTTQITVQGSATDPLSNGVQAGLHANAYLFNRNGTDVGIWQGGTLVNTGLTPNTQYTYKYKARDRVGNISNYSSTTAKYTLALNPTAVTVSGTTNNSLKFSITNNPSNGSPPQNKLEVKLKGAGTQVASSGFTSETNITIGGLTPGIEYEVWATTKNGDGVENPAVMVIESVFANHIPIIIISQPSSNQIFSEVEGYNTISVSGTVKDSDAGDVVKIFYRIDGTSGEIGTQIGDTIVADTSNQAWSRTINVSWVSEGAHTLYIWAEDNKGGKSEEKSISFDIDKAPPIVSVPTVIVDSISQITVIFSAVDDTNAVITSGLHDIPYQLERSGTSVGSWQQDYSFVDINLSPNTRYTYKVKARDNVGNIGESLAISKYTLAENPIGVEFISYDANSKTVTFKVVHTPQGEVPQAKIQLESQATVTSSWSTNDHITINNVDVGKTYQVFVQVKNGDGVENEPILLIPNFNVGLPALESISLSSGMHNSSNPLKVTVKTRVSNIKTESDKQIKVYYTINGLTGHSNQQMQPLNNIPYNYVHTGELGQYEGTINFNGTEEQGAYEIKVWVTNGTGYRNIISEDKVETFTIGKDTTAPETFLPGQEGKEEGDVVDPPGEKAGDSDFENLNGMVINYNGEEVIAVQTKTITFSIDGLQDVRGVRFSLTGTDTSEGAWENYLTNKSSITKTISFSSEGLNALQFQFKDKYGNHSIWYKQKYLVDWNCPSLSLRNPYKATMAKIDGTYEVELDTRDNISNKLYYKIENVNNIESKGYDKTRFVEANKNNIITLRATRKGVCVANVYVVDDVGNVTKQSITFFNR